MRLQCLGTTGYHPTATRHTACYYVPELGLVLDAGSGLFRLIELLQSEPKDELDIVLSHAHLDHVIGLTFLLDVKAATSLKKVRVYGLASKLAAVQQHLFHHDLFPVSCDFDLIPLVYSQPLVQLANCTLEIFALEHPGGSTGMIVHAQGKRLGYVTDTVPQANDEFIRRLSGVDLLMHECYFDDQHRDLSLRTGHSWLSAVRDIIVQCRPASSLLIHVNPLAETLGQEPQLSAEDIAMGLRFAKDCMEIDF